MNNPNNFQSKLKHAIDFAQDQVWSLSEKYPDFMPMYTQQGKWKHEGESWTHWCDGFLGGMMWIFYSRTGQSRWLEKASHYSRLIENRKLDREVHDLGFLFWSTYYRWLQAAGNPGIAEVLVTAGRTMGLRYQEKGGYLSSFIGADSLFIDIMMNVGIVFYAALQSGDEALLEKAHQHCQTTRRYLVRGDGSTAHEGLFDVETGEFLRQSTHQGYRGDSCWARGLAWALYGFCSAYTLTGERSYLLTSQMCADYYLEKTSFEPNAQFGRGVPPNDFDDPRLPAHPESSAAAIAASGLLDLSAVVQQPILSKVYLEKAIKILDTLCGPEYLASSTPGWEGILKHGIYHLNKKLGVDESVMWGDYFFVEAVDKMLTLTQKIRSQPDQLL
jgi:unsaturated chondroitin disaccharide hydrolase